MLECFYHTDKDTCRFPMRNRDVMQRFRWSHQETLHHIWELERRFIIMCRTGCRWEFLPDREYYSELVVELNKTRKRVSPRSRNGEL